jgi:predicted sulfurtransferase
LANDRVVTPKEATWNDVLAEARLGNYRIISTDELWERYEKDPDKMLLVDTRQEWEYRTGHIKKAQNPPPLHQPGCLAGAIRKPSRHFWDQIGNALLCFWISRENNAAICAW